MRTMGNLFLTGLLLFSPIRASTSGDTPGLLQHRSSTAANNPITLIHPTGGEVFSSDDTIQIKWEFDSLQVTFMGVFFSLDSGLTWKEILDTQDIRSRDSLLWIPSQTSFNFSGKGIKIRVKDYGSISSDVSGYFTIVKENGITFQHSQTAEKITWTIQSNTISILGNRTTEILQLFLYSCNGRLLFSERIPPGQERYTLFLPDNSPGYYCITLNHLNKTVIFKKFFIIIQ